MKREITPAQAFGIIAERNESFAFCSALGPYLEGVGAHQTMSDSWIIHTCSLFGERRRYLPAEIFKDRLSFDFVKIQEPAPMLTGVPV